MEGVGAEFEDAAELARAGGGPEGEFLHERGAFGGYEGFEFLVEGGEVGVVGDAVERVVVAVVALVFPDMNCQMITISNDSVYKRRLGVLPKVSQSPTSVLQLPTKWTLLSGIPAILGYHFPTNSTYSSTLSGLTS